MDIDKLKVLIDSEPSNATKNNRQLLNWCNDPSINKRVFYRMTVRNLMADLGPATADAILTKLEAAAPSDSVLNRALKVMSPVEGGIDAAHLETRKMINSLVSGNVLLSAEGELLKGLGIKVVSPCEDAGLPKAKKGHIQEVRKA